MKNLQTKIKQVLAITLSSTMLLSNINVYAMDSIILKEEKYDEFETLNNEESTETSIIEETVGTELTNSTKSNNLDAELSNTTNDTDISNTETALETDTYDTETVNESTSISTNNLDEFANEISILCEDDNLEENNRYATKRLLVTSNTPDFDNYNADSITHYDNLYVLQYASENAAKNAYKKMKSDTSIISVDVDSVVQIQSVKTSISTKKSTDNALSESIESKNVNVALLDTGYDMDSYSTDRIVNTNFNISNSGDASSIKDDNGHGTELANIILNNSYKSVKVMPLKIADSNGLTSSLKVYLGIKYAIEQNADIINISMSSYKSSNSALLENIINEASAKGIFVVVAAGNANSDTINYSPANIDSAITVSAVNNDYSKMNYSNYGTNIDYCSFGKVATNGLGGTEIETDGTSVSAAIVSLVIAQIKSLHNDYDYSDICNFLNDIAVDLGDVGKDSYFGNGFLSLNQLSGLKNDDDYISSPLLTADWKNLSDEELNNLISESDETSQKKFLDDLCKSDLDELLSRNIMFNNEHVYITYDIDDNGNWIETGRHIDTLYNYLYSDDFQDFQIQTSLLKKGTANVKMNTSKNASYGTLTVTAQKTDKATVSGTNGGAYNFNSVKFNNYIKGREGLDTYTQVSVSGIKISKEKHQILYSSNWWTKSNTSLANTGGWASKNNLANKDCSSTTMTSKFIVGLDDIGANQTYTLNIKNAKTTQGGVTRAATCTTNGAHQYSCSECGASYDVDDIPALGHTWPGYWSYDTTNHWQVCGRAADVYMYAPEAHSYTTSVITNPTCTSVGTHRYTCTTCGYYYDSADIPALGHAYTASVITNATCTSVGTHRYTCSRCGNYYDAADIPALGHSSPSAYSYTTNNSVTNGLRYKNCTRCGTRLETAYYVSLLKGTGISSVSGNGYYSSGQTVTLSATPSSDYKFKSWSGTYSSTVNNYSFTMPSNAVSLTANTEEHFVINFNDNGGSGGPGSKTINGKGDIPSTKPTKDGYKFMGWGATSSWAANRFIYSGATTAKDGTKATQTSSTWDSSKYASALGLSSISNSITVYAQWEAIPFTINFNDNGGSGGPGSTTINGKGDIPSKKPVKTGYNFMGWGATTDWAANRFIYSGATSAKDGTKATQTSSSWTASKYASILGLDSIGTSVTVYAQWELASYTLTINPNGGTMKIPDGNNTQTSNSYSQTFTYSTPVNISSEYDYVFFDMCSQPTKVGYQFTGWKITTGGGNISYTYVYRSDKGYIFDGNYAGNVTVTAQWEPINYTITYNLNGGSATNKTSYNIETATFALTNPTKTGYTFTGWTGSNGTTKQTSVSIAKGSTGNKTYTASWSANQYPVTYIDVVDSTSGKQLNKTTKQVNYGTSVRGSELGSGTADNNYYNGYYFVSDTSATVGVNGATVYRIFKQRMSTVSGNIAWNDWNNKNSSRPDSVTLHINGSDGKTYTFTIKGDNSKNTSTNTWSYNEQLPKYDSNGIIVTYTISQDKAISKEEGLAYKDPVVNSYNITNTINPRETQEYVHVSTSIVWNDNNNQYGFRPASITLNLLQNGNIISTISTSESEHTFNKLQKYDDNGDKYTYTIEATNTDRYTKTIDNDSFAYEKIITYTFQSPTYSVIIPKTVVIDGKNGIGKYTVSVKGNIDNRDFIKVIPDNSFTMKNAYLSSITAIVQQEVTSFTNQNNIKSGAKTTGTITAKSLAGKWSGNFNFNIYFEFGK